MVKNRFDDSDKVLWYLKKEEGSFKRIELPVGCILYGEPRVNTMIYRATNELISVLKNGSNSGELMKFKELVAQMTQRGFNENWTDLAVRKLKQQNRVESPLYGYYILRKF